MQASQAAAQVSVPGFTDHHAHLLRDAAGVGFPPTARAVRDFHVSVAEQGRSPMDVLDLAPDVARPALDSRLLAGLARAAAAGLVEVTEMGVRSWARWLHSRTPARCRAGSGSIWRAAWPMRQASTSWTPAVAMAGRGCG